MRTGRSLSFALAVVAVGALAACAKSSSEGPTAAASGSVAAASAWGAPSAGASASTVASAALKKSRKLMRRGGIASAFLAAATELPSIKPEQSATIEALEAGLRGAPGGPPTEWKDLQTELASEIKAGKLDTAKLDPLYAAVDKAAEARRAKEAAALDGLHAALDAAQRKELTTALRERQKAHEAKSTAGPKLEDWRKRHAERLTKELGLDGVQEKQLEAALPKSGPTEPEFGALREAAQKRREALLTAFEADTFDATKLEIGPLDKTAKGPAHRDRELLAQLLPILKQDQRDKLAERMTGGGRGHGPGKGGGHGHGGRMGGGVLPGIESAIDDVFDEVEAAADAEATPVPAASGSATP
jgi:hypothetical protein